MPYKLNISDKGKAYKIELEDEILAGKSIGDKIDGKEIKPELEGYEFEITGGSDKSGFPMNKNVEGIGLKKVLLTKGFGMKNKQKGLRLRKTQRGRVISNAVVQINMKVIKQGGKKLDEIFASAPAEGEASADGAEKPVEEKKEEPIKEETKAEEKSAE